MARASILLYHWFRGETRTNFPVFDLSLPDFRSQMDWLVESKRPVVTVREVASAARGEAPLPKGAVAITFDDAYDDFHEQALPVLAERGLPATLFAVAEHVGGVNAWDRKFGEPERTLMSWQRLREASTAGVEIGSHSLSHPDLRTVPDHRLREECAGSRRRLEDGLGKPVRLFAFPHGRYDSRVKEAARQAGYEAACAVLLRPLDLLRSDVFSLMRAIVHADRGFGSFRRRVRLAAPHHRRG